MSDGAEDAIEDIRSIYRGRAAAGDVDAAMVLGLIGEVDRLNAERDRLRKAAADAADHLDYIRSRGGGSWEAAAAADVRAAIADEPVEGSGLVRELTAAHIASEARVERFYDWLLDEIADKSEIPRDSIQELTSWAVVRKRRREIAALKDERDRLRADRKIDRAVVRSLVEALNGSVYIPTAAVDPLAAMHARMATWDAPTAQIEPGIGCDAVPEMGADGPPFRGILAGAPLVVGPVLAEDEEPSVGDVAAAAAPVCAGDTHFILPSPDEVYEIAMRHSARIKAERDGAG